MSRVKLNIDKSILAWAIERSGKDCCAYLEQHPKVKEWMDDLDRPTLKQLERFRAPEGGYIPCPLAAYYEACNAERFRFTIRYHRRSLQVIGQS